MSDAVPSFRPMRLLTLLAGGTLVLVALLLVHLSQGLGETGLWTVWQALFTTRQEVGHQIVRHLYLPRAVMAVLAGAGLGASGVLLQTVMRNPLASPTTLGVNSGAYLAVVGAAVFLPQFQAGAALTVSFLGGLGAAALVYVVGGGMRVSPVRLTLAGVAVAMGLASVTSTLQIFYEHETAGLFFWGSGSLMQRDWAGVWYALPRLAAGGVLALGLARSLDVLRLGEDVARGLGQRVHLVRSLAVLVGVFLAAATVAVTGPIGFVGLVAPHLAGLLGLRRHLFLIPAAALLGGVLLLGADTVVRLLHGVTGEVPAGVVTALVGAPWLIWLAQSARGRRVGGRSESQSPSGRVLGRGMRWLAMGGAVAALLLALGLGVAMGDVHLEASEVVAALLGEGSRFTQRLVLELRLPRVLVAGLAGAALAVSGALFQGVIRNPLAAPETLGVTGGAGLGALICVLLFPTLPAVLTPIGAFIGAVMAFAACYLLASRGGMEPVRLALIGIAVAAFCMAVISVLVVQAEVRVAQALVWLAGSTYARGMDELVPLAVGLLVLMPLAWMAARPLDVLGLGDDAARGVGLALDRTRLGVLTLATALAAVAVATVGAVGFLGLIAPHAARMLVGSRHRWLNIMAAILGALVLVGADLIGRVVVAPRQIPSGLVTALLGAPYFLWLLYRSRR